MDAATRAELDLLRLRAYGPAADIDPAAVRRLIDLEAENLRDREAATPQPAPVSKTGENPPEPGEQPGVHRRVSRILDGDRSAQPGGPKPRRAAASVRPTPPSEPPQPAAPPSGPVPRQRARRRPAPRQRARRRPVVLAAAAVALAAAGLGSIGLARMLVPPEPETSARTVLAPAVREARSAYSFAWDRDAVPLLYIPLDGSFGRYIDLPSAADVPEFPATGTVEWAYPLGKYFGWDVWIAGASVDGTGLGREHCIAVVKDDELRARCVPARLRAQSALLVSVPFAALASDERPVGMGPDERLGFWWNRDRSVTVMIGDAR